MRRLLSDLAAARDAWDRFLFAPADPRPLGLIRAVAGLLLLWSLGIYGLDLRAFLGPDGFADPEVVRDQMGPGSWSLWFLVPDRLIWPAWGGCMAVAACLAAGLFSRVMAPMAWVIAVSTARRAPITVFGFDQVLAMLLLYMAVSGASGQAYSVDRWWARRRGKAPSDASIPANLSIRLIQVHLCVIYAMSGLAKLRGNAWWEGRAVGMLLADSEFRPGDMSALLAYPYLINLATHAALAVELGYAALVWPRRARPYVVATAMSMHVGIAATLGLYEFALAMIAANLAFLSPALLARRSAPAVESREVAPTPPPAASASPRPRSRR